MDDLISREAAIDAVLNICNTPCNEYFANAIKALPSADRTGEWIKDKYGYTVCSECGWNAPRIMTGSFVTKHLEEDKSEFCWHCGARMEGGE